METVMYRGWNIRTVSVVEGPEFSAAALLEKQGAALCERRRYAFSGLARHNSPGDAEFQAVSWAKRWIESWEFGDPSPE